jgi:hypothetical protein
MIKVYCIKNEHDDYIFKDLQIGESYDAELMSNKIDYRITLKEPHCEFRTTAYPITWFITQGEWREKQMGSIIDEEQ